MNNEIEILIDEIVNASRNAFLELFTNGEKYYYLSLITTEEGFPPVISAWSWEALNREFIRYAKSDRDHYINDIKWSYADSPYFNFGERYFDKVKSIFNERPSIINLDCLNWESELLIRVKCMEIAMKRLDGEGIFEMNQLRKDVCILVEIMPPQTITTEIALRLNDPINIKDWLNQAAE